MHLTVKDDEAKGPNLIKLADILWKVRRYEY